MMTTTKRCTMISNFLIRKHNKAGNSDTQYIRIEMLSK
jgi:hypothetical protein